MIQNMNDIRSTYVVRCLLRPKPLDFPILVLEEFGGFLRVVPGCFANVLLSLRASQFSYCESWKQAACTYPQIRLGSLILGTSGEEVDLFFAEDTKGLGVCSSCSGLFLNVQNA